MLRNVSGPIGEEFIKQEFDAMMGLHDEREQNAEAMADRLREFAAAGGDKKALKRCVSLARKDREKVQQEQAIFDIYREAIGLD